MVRVLGFLFGLLLVFVAGWSLLWGAIAYVQNPPVKSVEARFHREPKEIHYASDGPFGKFDREQLQRGFQVYKEVCSACHAISHVAFRDLGDLGYSPAEVKAIATQWQIEIPSINPQTGEPATRKAIPSDHFPSPFANEVAARAANNNALPPDLSLMTKAREGGAPYVYSILTGFQDPPANLPPENRPATGLHYNPYFANLNIAMPPPLVADGQVQFADGTKSTVDQMARDVSAFLVWTAEPKLENRHRTGIVVLLFLLAGTILAWFSYRNIWADAKGRRVAAVGVLDPENMAKRDSAAGKAGIDG